MSRDVGRATLLKVWLEAVAKMVVQRDRPGKPRCDLRGQSAAHGLSCPSGHAMVIFAITALVPYFKGWGGHALDAGRPLAALRGLRSTHDAAREQA